MNLNPELVAKSSILRNKTPAPINTTEAVPSAPYKFHNEGVRVPKDRDRESLVDAMMQQQGSQQQGSQQQGSQQQGSQQQGPQQRTFDSSSSEYLAALRDKSRILAYTNEPQTPQQLAAPSTSTSTSYTPPTVIAKPTWAEMNSRKPTTTMTTMGGSKKRKYKRARKVRKSRSRTRSRSRSRSRSRRNK